MFRAWQLVPDELIPGTLNVGHVAADGGAGGHLHDDRRGRLHDAGPAAGGGRAGAWFGAGIVAGMPRRTVQVAMGSALFVAAGIMLLQLLGLVPGGGAALGLTGVKLAIGVGVNFVLGALMTLGIGLYAPCMIMISLLGMNPTAAFPIMMGSCAFLMPVGGMQVHPEGRLPPARRGRPGAGRPAGGAGRRLHRQVAAAALRALAGGGRRGLHGLVDDLAPRRRAARRPHARGRWRRLSG